MTQTLNSTAWLAQGLATLAWCGTAVFMTVEATLSPTPNPVFVSQKPKRSEISERATYAIFTPLSFFNGARAVATRGLLGFQVPVHFHTFAAKKIDTVRHSSTFNHGTPQRLYLKYSHLFS
jgi:hypothetical protein